MCLAVYLASDVRLPVVGGTTGRGLYVSDSAGDLRTVQQDTPKRHVYYVGTHTGCGCGFRYVGWPVDSTEYRDAQHAYQALAEYLGEYAADGGVEVLVYWGGDEHLPPQERRVVRISTLTQEGFVFEEGIAFEILP